MSLKTVAAWMPVRDAQVHKGDFGHAVVVAGSPAMPGAACLALRAARRSGVGRLSWVACERTLGRAFSLPPEVLLREWPLAAAECQDVSAWDEALAGASGLLVGPGLHSAERTRAALEAAGRAAGVPVCLDADALRLCAVEPHLLAPLSGRAVLTPHPGEMAALCGVPTTKVQADRSRWAARLAEAHRVVVVLKGAGTIVAAPVVAPTVLPAGGPELAHAGTGDVLAGLLVGLLAQGLPPLVAAQLAATVHAEAGAKVRLRHGVAGLCASDVADAIGLVWHEADR